MIFAIYNFTSVFGFGNFKILKTQLNKKSLKEQCAMTEVL